MKYIAKSTMMLLLVFIGCKKGNELFDSGGPIARYLMGNWTLVKVVTPSQTKSDSQIGYNQTMFIGNEGVGNFDKVFKDSLLVITHKWGPTQSGSAATMTIIVDYTDGLERSFKILRDSGKTMLQTSEYLTRVGSPQDSVTYYYKSSN